MKSLQAMKLQVGKYRRIREFVKARASRRAVCASSSVCMGVQASAILSAPADETRPNEESAFGQGILPKLLLGLLVGILVVLRPAEVPPLWFDEGWVLSLARNWVQLGHYGHLLMGERVPPSILNTGLPAVAPVALSFRLLGIGPWQGRLPGIVFTVGGLGMLYYLARRLYDRSVSAVALSVALLLSAERSLHPVLLGRQALGEMPSVFYLLSGFALFSWAWQKPRPSMPLALLLWALSLRTKPQVLPFFVVALSFPLAVALWQRCWRTARLLASGLAGTLATLGVLAWGEKLLFSSRLFSATSASDPYKVLGDASNLRTYVCTLVPSVRLLAVSMAVLFAMPLVLGVCYNGLKFAKCLHDRDMHSGQKVCRLSLWCMVCAWLAWYLLLSIGWTRYLFPAMFLGSIFVAVLLRDLVGGFNLPRLVVQGAKVLRQRHFTLRGTGILLTGIVIPMLFLATMGMLYKSFVLLPDDSVVQAAQFLNTHTKTDALVETYDSEIFFLLERSYHYPPDSVQHQLNRRAFFAQDNVIDYDPMAHDPDYLVVGTMSRWWGLYQPVLDSGAFRLLQTYGGYEIYGRVN